MKRRNTDLTGVELPAAIGGRPMGRIRATGLWRIRRLWRSLAHLAALGLKRTMDVLGASLLLVLLLPLLVLIAVMIKLEDPGPVLFWALFPAVLFDQILA